MFDIINYALGKKNGGGGTSGGESILIVHLSFSEMSGNTADKDPTDIYNAAQNGALVVLVDRYGRELLLTEAYNSAAVFTGARITDSGVEIAKWTVSTDGVFLETKMLNA